MKKLFFVLVAIIGFSVGANAQCSKKTCLCGNTLHYNEQAYWENCNYCFGKGVVSEGCNDCYDCTECNRTGKQKCNSNDGHNRYDRWTHCRDCSLCGGDGYRNGLRETGCTRCGGNSRTAGAGGRWKSGCKCSDCGRGYQQ